MKVSPLLARFLDSLASACPPTGFRNPYGEPVALHNLGIFFARQDPAEQRLLFVGEAPGYRGAAISGVALTSVSILTDDWQDPWGEFGPASQYASPEVCVFRKEATATMVWGILAELCGDGPLPITWNAVPFHPRGTKRDSNASLAPGALSIGRPWIEQILELFPNSAPIAVGRRAGEALAILGVQHAPLRHPSRGGKKDFERGLSALVRSI